MSLEVENYVQFSNLYQSLTLLEKEYLRKLHDAKQEELANKLVQDKESRSFNYVAAQKEFEKRIPFEMTTKVKELYGEYVEQHSQGTGTNLLNSENFSDFLDQLDVNPELIEELEAAAAEQESETEIHERYKPYISNVPFKPIIHKVDVHDAQSSWLDKYVKLGNQQIEIVQDEQQYLERNIFSRLWNRRQILNNRKYLSNLSTTVKDMEWQQSKYLHNPIEITAQNELDSKLAKQFTEKINAHFQSRIDQLTSTVTLENFESSTQQYNLIKSDLFTLEQWRFNKNSTFPGFYKTVDQLHLLGVDESSLDQYVKDYLSSVKDANSQGLGNLNEEQKQVLDSMNIESLIYTNELLEQCMVDYAKSMESFVKGFDTDGHLVEAAIDSIKSYKIDPNYIQNRQEQALLKEFDEFYISCSDREKDYIHELNNVNLEVMDNLNIIEEKDKSYIYKENLENNFSDLTSQQIEYLRAAYNKFIESNNSKLNRESFLDYTKELNMLYNTNYPKDSLESEQLIESKGLEQNIESDQLQSIQEYSQDELDQMEMYSAYDNEIPDIAENIVFEESGLSVAEKELAAALEDGDLQKIADARAKVNKAKLDQVLSQNIVIENQKKIDQEENLQANKELAIDLYSEYLTTGKLTEEQLRKLVSVDKTLSDFDKVNIRLEAIEKVKAANPELSLDRYIALLESTRGDSDLTSNLLESEYYHMSTNKVTNDLHLIAENNFELILD